MYVKFKIDEISRYLAFIKKIFDTCLFSTKTILYFKINYDFLYLFFNKYKNGINTDY